jgi:hypothetical protein
MYWKIGSDDYGVQYVVELKMSRAEYRNWVLYKSSPTNNPDARELFRNWTKLIQHAEPKKQVKKFNDYARATRGTVICFVWYTGIPLPNSKFKKSCAGLLKEICILCFPSLTQLIVDWLRKFGNAAAATLCAPDLVLHATQVCESVSRQ